MRTLAIALLVFTLLNSPLAAQEKWPGLPAMTSEEACRLLGQKDTSLPAWARTLASPLPKTTVAMLELDYLHRAKTPLEPILAAKLRWTAARTLGSVYGQRYAEADLRRLGLSEDDLKRLGTEKGASDEAICLKFGQTMTRSASSVTDEVVADLLKRFGPEKVVAMVHTLAYANFHNRVIVGLGVEVEPDGPLPPLQVDPASRTKIVTPKRPPLKEPSVVKSLPGFQLDWNKQTIEDLTKAVDQQKARKSRIPLPDPAHFAKLPPGAKQQAENIVWMNISMGYQPQLTAAWFECLRAFQSEAAFDRVYSNSVFWVITRSNECFY